MLTHLIATFIALAWLPLIYAVVAARWPDLG